MRSFDVEGIVSDSPEKLWQDADPEDGMHDLICLIKGCQARVDAPAGTHSICREHFLSYLTWPALLMNTSASIADPLLRRAFGQRARDMAQRFRDEPS